MDQGQISVGADHKVRSLTENVAAAAVTVEVIRQKRKFLVTFTAQVDGSAAADLGEGLESRAAGRIGDFVGNLHTGDFKMEFAAGIERQFRDDIGKQRGRAK